MTSLKSTAAALALAFAGFAAPVLALPLAAPSFDAPDAAQAVRCKLGSGKCGIDPKSQPGAYDDPTGGSIDDAADWLDDECEFYPGLCVGRTASPAGSGSSGQTVPPASAARGK